MRIKGQNQTFAFLGKLTFIAFVSFILSVNFVSADGLKTIDEYTFEGDYEENLNGYDLKAENDEYYFKENRENFGDDDDDDGRGDDEDDDGRGDDDDDDGRGDDEDDDGGSGDDDDNGGSGDGDDETHNAGTDCQRCHSFKIAGTVYSDLTGSSAVSGATINVSSSSGTISMTSDRLGNFYSNSSFSGSYSASVQYGSSVLAMVTRPTDGGCNSGSCHASGGSAGGRVWVSADGGGASTLSAPTNFSSRVSGSTLTLSWNSVSGASGYNLYYGLSSGSYIGPFPLGSGTSVSFATVPDGVYYATVTASSGLSESSKSSEVTIIVGNGTTTTTTVSAPTGFAVSVSGSDLTLRWNAVDGATDYILYYGYVLNDYNSSVSLGNVTSKTFKNVPQGTYYAALTASNGSSESAESTDIEIVVGSGGSNNSDDGNDDDTTTTTSSVTYTNDVKSIMDSKCTVCHKSGGIRSQSPLTTYSEVKAQGNDLLSAPGTGTMAGTTYTSSEKSTITDWINGGYQQ